MKWQALMLQIHSHMESMYESLDFLQTLSFIYTYHDNFTTSPIDLQGHQELPQTGWILQWCHNERDDVLNHRPLDCLLNRLFRYRSKKTSKLRVTGLCEGNSQVTGEFPAQRASNAENVSIWWRHNEHINNISKIHITLLSLVEKANLRWNTFVMTMW